MQEDRYVQTIRELLHKKRFDHSLNVAQRAVELAKRYGRMNRKRTSQASFTIFARICSRKNSCNG